MSSFLLQTVKIGSGCYFPSGPPDRHLAPSPVWVHTRPLRIVVAIMPDIRAGVEKLVGEIISPLWIGRIRVRLVGRARVRIGLNVGFGLGL